jgi:hypothetical protein
LQAGGNNELVVQPRRAQVAQGSLTTNMPPVCSAQRLLADAQARSHSVRARSKNLR